MDKDFDCNDFKKWINNQKDINPEKQNSIGFHVESKINLKKLISRIDVQDGENEEIAEEFKEYGGIIQKENDNKFLIEVDSGSFIIHKMYVKKSRI